MKTPAMLSLLIIVLISQMTSAQYTVQDFRDHLAAWEARFLQVALTNPTQALEQSDIDLERAMEIAAPLFAIRINPPPSQARLLEADDSSQDMIDLLQRVVQANLNVTEIRDYAQGICTDLQFPYTDSIRDNPENQRFIKRIDMRVMTRFCNPLNLDSRFARCYNRRLERQLNGTRDRFVATARTSNELNLDMFWADIATAMNISTVMFKRGIKDPQQTSNLMINTITRMLQDSSDVMFVANWARDICNVGTFPFPAFITSEGEFARFTSRLDDRVPGMCITLGPQLESTTTQSK